MRLRGKIALVTGSSRGIGKATALLFAKEGAKVIVNYVEDENDAKNVVDTIKRIGSEAIAVKCDVSNEKDVSKMVQEAVKKFGRVDILVNNAGIVFDVSFRDRTVDHWKRTLEVNLIGAFICSKYVVPHMKGGGRIINISSTNGTIVCDPGSMDYGTSKAGIIALTKTLSKELAPNILVNSIAPGWVDTDMNKNLPKEYVRSEMEKIYLKRMADPEEIASVALFLASEDSRYMTGSLVVVDGGM